MSTAEAVEQSGLRYVFTDGHAIMAPTDFYDDLGDLDKVDMPLMSQRYWNDIDEDPDRKRRRQAEFLVRDFAPCSLIDEIVVMNRKTLDAVKRCLSSAGLYINTRIERSWYY